jgi:hypothetical protein
LGEIKNQYIQEIQEIEFIIPNYLCYAEHVVKPTYYETIAMIVMRRQCCKGNVAKSDHGTKTYLDYNSKGSPQKR